MVRTCCFLLPWAPIPSLVRELSSHKPCCTARNKSNKPKGKTSPPSKTIISITVRVNRKADYKKRHVPPLHPLPKVMIPKNKRNVSHPPAPPPTRGNDTPKGFTRMVTSWGSGPWTGAEEGVPSHGALVRCDHQRQVCCVLPEHSFSGDHGKDLPLKLLLLLHSLSLQMKSPSNQLPKLDSAAGSPSSMYADTAEQRAFLTC